MSVLVTGANGFIGSHVARALLASGQGVRAFVQTGTDRRNLKGLDLEIVEGDLRDSQTIVAGIRGCRTVFHLAAYNQLWSPSPAVPFEINVKGTAALVTEAVRQGVETLLYASSATLFRSPNGRPAREEDFVCEAPENAYERSKFLAEQEVLRFAKQGLRVISIAPTAPIGPGDLNLTGPGRLIVDYLRRKMPAYLETGFNVVDVRALAQAFVTAARNGASGERYIVGGVNLSLRELFSTLEELTGIPAPKWKVPYWLAYSVSLVSETYADWISKKPPMAPLEGVRLAKRPCFYDCQKADSALQVASTDLKHSLREEINWFRENGYA